MKAKQNKSNNISSRCAKCGAFIGVNHAVCFTCGAPLHEQTALADFGGD